MSGAPSVSEWKYCCDPLKRHSKLVSGHGLQHISKAMADNHSLLSLQPGQMICSGCRQHLSRVSSKLQVAMLKKPRIKQIVVHLARSPKILVPVQQVMMIVCLKMAVH